MNAYEDNLTIAQDQSLCTRLLSWYTREHRDLPWRKSGDPYAIWVSEVMLQQTQVKTVIPYYERFLLRFPNVYELGTANIEEVLAIWSGLGYYSRARRLWEGANYILHHLDGKIPKDYEALLQIPGVGDYTAGAIASIAFGQRAAAIDGNVKRVLSRLLAWNDPVESARSIRYFRERIMEWQSVRKPGDFNQALMELGAMVCTSAKPVCECCPLAEICKAYLIKGVLHYPIKKPKTQRKELTRLTFVLRRKNEVYLQKRPSKGLLAGLWEFPGVEICPEDMYNSQNGLPHISKDEYPGFFRKAVAERTFDTFAEEQFRQGVISHGPVWYTFSHRRWKIIWVIIDLPEKLCNCSLRELEGGYGSISTEVNPVNCWVSLENIGDTPLPVAFNVIIEFLESTISLQALN